MARQHGPGVLSDLRALFDGGLVAGLSDAELLERHAARGIANSAGEAAFAVLVDRHGPMVWGVCRQILGDVHDAEDAFQATFLVVARQAGRAPESAAVGRWIYGIARRVALRARADARRSRALGATLNPTVSGEAEREALRAELGAVVGEEVARLPERYRAAVELCFLRGMTNEAAARELGWPIGTVKTRLARARKRLQSRLTVRGLAPAAVAGAAAPQGARAAPPAALVRATVRAVSGFTAAGASGTFPESVAVLAMGVLRAMFVKKVIQSVAAVAAVLVAGASVYAFQDVGKGRSATATARAAPVIGGAMTGEFRNPEAQADERAGDVANLVERLARRAAELQGQKKYSDAHAVVCELADVVGQWERRLHADLVFRAYHESTGAGGAIGLTSQCALCHVYKSEPVIQKEQRLGRVEQQLGEIFKRLDRRADGKQSPMGAPDQADGAKLVDLINRIPPGSSLLVPADPRAPMPHDKEPRSPAADSLSQRLGQVEQQLGEILKRLDRRAGADDVPKADPFRPR